MEHSLDIKNFSKSYKGFQLRDITFSLPKGNIMGLIGPNGSGKTTIIKAIMNMVTKDSGSIQVLDKDHLQHEVSIKKEIAYLGDAVDQYNHLSVKGLKNIIAPFFEKWDEDFFQEIIKKFGLPLNKSIKKLSKGMQMQGGIAIALSHHAKVIILDEPTAGLDPIIRRELLDMLRNLMDDEMSILFSTHITTDIERIADYITFISNGELVFSAPKDDVMNDYRLVKGGLDLLDADTEHFFIGIKRNEFGFEAMTNQKDQVMKHFGDHALIEKASLEDIMYYNRLNH